MKKILLYISKYKILLFLSFIGSIIAVVLTLFLPFLVGKSFDCIVGIDKVEFNRLFFLTLIMLGVIVSNMLIQWLTGLVNAKLIYRLVEDLRNEAFRKIGSLPIGFLNKTPIGDLLNRVISDIEQFLDGLLLGFSNLAGSFITLVGTVFFMLSISVEITLVVLIITPFSLILARFISKKTFKRYTSQAEKRARIMSYMNEAVTGMEVIKVYRVEDKIESEFTKINEELANETIMSSFLSSLTNPTTRFINNIVYVFVGGICAYRVINGDMTVGGLVSFLAYSSQYAKPLNEISSLISEFQNALVSANRVFDFLAERDEIDTGKYEMPKKFEKIEFRNVFFSYDKSKPLIENLNLNIRSGERVAIVGTTGSGKSTLINLLMRYYRVDSGKILIDGMNIEDIKIDELRKNCGIILQDSWIKNVSVAENIALGREVDREEIISACKVSYAHNFIMKLKDGYDTILSDDTREISNGERQLLCIARVMLKSPPIMILDEATSSIDTRTEIMVQKALERLMEGKTVFIVAHRLQTIRNSNLILVMQNGSIVEMGKHEELMRKRGFYYELYSMTSI